MSAPILAPGMSKRGSVDSRSRGSPCFHFPSALTVTDLSASPSASTLISTSAPNALYNFRLLEALRSDDPAQVQPFLDELGHGGSGGAEDEGKAGRLLGMAVRVASGMSAAAARQDKLMPVPIIHLILSSQAVSSPNLPVSSGSSTTPLHVASEIGRADVGEFADPGSCAPTSLHNIPRSDIVFSDWVNMIHRVARGIFGQGAMTPGAGQARS